MLVVITIWGILALMLSFAVSRKGMKLLDIVTWSLTLWLFGYATFAALLHLIYSFSITNAALCTAIVSSVAAIAGCIKSDGIKKISVKLGSTSCLIKLLLSVIIGLAVTISPFSYAGMGQDEGVYQTEAICYINGMTDRQFDYDEYYKLESLGLGDEYLSIIKSGPNMAGAYTASECNISEILTGVQRDCISETSSVFHGIHTFSSLMAWFGSIFGIANMTKVNALILALCVLWMFKISDNLKLNKIGLASALICFILCPQVLWCTKSALTEIGLTLIWLVFIYAITTREKLGVYLSSYCVMVYGFYHLSLYVFMPLFALLYLALFFYNADKTYLKGLILASTGFIITLWYSLITACKYSVENFSPVAKAFITKENACVYATIAALFLIVLAGILMWIFKAKTLNSISAFCRNQSGAKLFAWLIRGVMALSLLYVAYRLLRGRLNTEILSYNTLGAFALLTGIGFFLLAIGSLLIFAGKWSNNASHLTIAAMFIYCIMLFANILHPQIEYFYYYSRYVTMYIPMIGLVAGVCISTLSNKHTTAKTALSCCLCAVCVIVMFPHAKFVITNQDDSRYDWDNITSVNNLVESENIEAAFIRPELCTAYYYNLKSLGVDVYPITDSFEAVYDEISSWYDSVIIIDGANPYDYTEDGTCTYESHAAQAGYPVVMTLEDTMTEDLGFYRDTRTGLPNGMFSASFDIVVYRYK